MNRITSILRYFRRPESRDLAMVLKLWLLTAVMVIIGLMLLAPAASAMDLRLATSLALVSPAPERAAGREQVGAADLAAGSAVSIRVAQAAPAKVAAMALSSGDRLNLMIQEGAEFSGKYQVSVAGELTLPHLAPVRVEDQDPAQAAQTLASALVEAGMFQPGKARVSIQVLEWAPVEVSVQGAVFYPGRHKINQAPARDRAPEKSEDLPGGRIHERYLSDALRAAGGITPEADVRRIQVTRNGVTGSYDLSGFFDGTPTEDVALRNGDTIVAPSTGIFDSSIVRPSRITPPGIKVFASNLTTPANNNNAATVTGGAISLAYGSRLAQAAVGANCSGGTRATNASRKIAMIRTDRLTGKTTTIDSSIEELIEQARPEANPLMLEGDSVVCYDSNVTNIRDIFRTIGDILLPFRTFLVPLR